MSDRNYYGEALNIVWDSNRGDTVLNLLLAAQDEISMFRTGLDAANARAEAAEAKLAAADEYGQYTEFQGRLNAPVYNFEVWWRWRAERLAQGEVKS